MPVAAEKRLTPSMLALLLVGLFIAAFWVAALPQPDYFLHDSDGGHQLTGAQQLLSGEHPFSSFRSSYGPMTFYASALGQLLTGNRLAGELLLLVCGHTAAYLLLFVLLYAASRKFALSFIILCFTLLLSPRLYKYYVVLGPALSLFAAWKYIDDRKPGSRALLAFSVAFTTLFRFDFGVYTGLSSLLTVFFVQAGRTPAGFRKAAFTFISLVLCFLAPWVLWCLYTGGLANYLLDTFSTIFHLQSGLTKPFPRPSLNGPLLAQQNLEFVVFYANFAIPCIVWLVLFLKRKVLDAKELQKTAIAIVLSQLTLIQSTHRSDVSHLLQANIINYVLIGWLLGVFWRDASRAAWRSRCYGAAFAAAFLVLGAASVRVGDNTRLLGGISPKASMANVRSLLGTRQDILEAVRASAPQDEFLLVVDYIRNNTRPTDKILVIAFHNSLYYFSERNFGGGQMLLAPGYFSLPEDQRAMVARLDRDKVPLVVENVDAAFDGLESRKVANFAPIIAGYIASNYEEVRRIGRFALKARK